jgi:BirA family transcriptional regulator, biotin operon repressor / biotin---[acetyl-CoA-carboxylase] ligase
MSNIFKSKKLIKLSQISSTNSYVAAYTDVLPEGSVVMALDQTAGRGLGGNKWASEPGKNLTFCIVLRPMFLQVSEQFYLSKIIALAVSDFVMLYTDRVSIKWPNDIYVGEKKISGILIEHSIEGSHIKQTIAGIGINLNQKEFSGVPNPISLSLLTGAEYDLDEAVEAVCRIIEYRYGMLMNKDFRAIDDNYMAILFRYKEIARYSASGNPFEGKIIGVMPSGELMIQNKQGDVHKFWHKEVEYLI